MHETTYNFFENCDVSRVQLDVQKGGSYNSVCVMLDYGPAMASGNNSVVECDLAKVEVAGSNPVSRSIKSSKQ